LASPVAGDIEICGDYTGNDGIAETAVFHPASPSQWFIQGNANLIEYGSSQAIPLPRSDYDGDGSDDIAVYEPSSQTFSVLGGFAKMMGLPGDKPLPGGDYDGDGLTDLAVARVSGGLWQWEILYSADINGSSTVEDFGSGSYLPVPGGDYDGDGQTDLAVYDGLTGSFIVKDTGTFVVGKLGDLPVWGCDFDGDGKTDPAVYRVGSASTFYVYKSSRHNESNPAAAIYAYTIGDSTSKPVGKIQ
jgi:hypothetical protein